MYLLTTVRRYTACTLALACLFVCHKASAALDLNGIASHSEFGKDQYMAALYLEDLSADAKQILLSNQRKRMEIKVVADRLFSRKFKRQWIEGVAINAGNFDLKKHAQNLADFSNMLKIKLVKDDTLTIERTFRRGVEVAVNGVMLGTIEDVEFFDLILRSWIGPVPLSTDFKADLLKAGSIEPDTLARFKNIRTTRERVAALNTGLAAAATAAVAAAAAPQAEKEKSSAPTQAAASEPSETASTSSASEALATETESTQQSAQASSSAVESSTAIAGTPSDSSSKSAAAAVAALPNQILEQEDVFDDEEDDFSYTAADLLSRQLYLSKLTRWTGSYIKYPKAALRRGNQGTVRVTVTIDRKGGVTSATIIKESPYKSLNKEALKAIKRASPYPAMPDIITGDSFEFTLPVVFALRDE